MNYLVCEKKRKASLFIFSHFGWTSIAFFSDVEIPGTPGALATTFLTFGKYILCSSFFPFNSFAWKKIEDTLIYTLLELADWAPTH